MTAARRTSRKPKRTSRRMSVEEVWRRLGSPRVDLGELATGIRVEAEHGVGPVKAGRIALDHLREFPDYYTRLVKMEERAKRGLAPNPKIVSLGPHAFYAAAGLVANGHPPALLDLAARARSCFAGSEDLLSKGYRGLERATPSAGLCAVATEAIWADARRYGYKSRVATWRGRPGTSPIGAGPCTAEDRKAGNCSSHWWLESPTGEVLDPTADQFSPRELRAIYAMGRGAGPQGVRYPGGVLTLSASARKLRQRMGVP